MTQDCERCRILASAKQDIKTRLRSLESADDRNSPRYLDTKGTVEARSRELDRCIADHEADAHYLDLLVMATDTLELMPLPRPPPS